LDKDRVFVNDKKITMAIDRSKIESEFLRIKALGFVKNNRPVNDDGGIGNTFEDHLGIDENNSEDPDFEEFEVKTKRQMSESWLSLFSKSPNYPKSANRHLRNTYGSERDEEQPGMISLRSSIYAHRWTEVYSTYKMKLEVDKENEVIRLLIRNMNDELIYNEVYWKFETIEKSAKKKLTNMFVVSAESKRGEDGILLFHYQSAMVYVDFNFINFIKAIEEGVVRLDLRLGSYKSGEKIGKFHDHGSGFRINKTKIDSIYDTFFIVGE